ncbi:Hsp70 family protein [Micromonospora sp. CPCC 205371]|nr:Hsp70 family protein [Micromonospora sp. CPCC 205371]
MGARLGIDFGTSNTAAVIRNPDGRSAPVLFDGFPLLPSAVCDVDGRLVTGRDALQWASSHPEAFEPTPKRCVDDGVILLGGREHPVDEVIGAVLERVVREAPHAAGDVTLTHPAGWGPQRRDVLVAAARRAGVRAPRLVAEPVAAARLLTTLHEDAVPEGHAIVVYDFGAGTFDASVMRRTAEGFELVAAEGLPDAGGLDVDAAILGHLAASVRATEPDMWRRLLSPDSKADRRHSRQLREDVRGAKEMLSRTSSASVYLPLIDVDTVLGREQFEVVARPVLERTVAATKVALRAAGRGAGPLAAIFLVGGSSRIPLAATLLHRAFGVAPTVVEQPELVVAHGSVIDAADPAPAALLDPAAPATTPVPAEREQAPPDTTTPGPPAAATATPPRSPVSVPWASELAKRATTRPVGDQPSPRWWRRFPVIVGVAAAALLVVTLIARGADGANPTDPVGGPAATQSRTATASPTGPVGKYAAPGGPDICGLVDAGAINRLIGKEPWTSRPEPGAAPAGDALSCSHEYRDGRNLYFAAFVTRATIMESAAAASVVMSDTRDRRSSQTGEYERNEVRVQASIGQAAFTYVYVDDTLTQAGVVLLDDNLVLDVGVYGLRQHFGTAQQRQTLLDTLVASARQILGKL